ncbi:alpha/beta hydrolase [Vibrio sp. S9_S30]|uniref:alpha/beta hydrolase n=1 Tax=Vibrio sp. S9_S30 TaxID=2720226 RepID=UPI0016806725|nr:alpha/beta hydrolase [Vibrio sp. S9_S30]MBD1557172.1 alpha/beta hydrolase [Vibrio sp. S9_S30]
MKPRYLRPFILASFLGLSNLSLAEPALKEYASTCTQKRLDEIGISHLDATVFRVIESGTTAEVTGIVCDGTLQAAQEMLEDHPNLNKLVFLDVGGSVDNVTNLKLATLIHSLNMHTHVSDALNKKNDEGDVVRGGVASGGTDLFLAGTTRTADKNAYIGVHSWSSGDRQGSKLPRTHYAHQPYIQFYKLIDLPKPEAFYFFTIESADAGDMHYMSRKELQTYKIMTQ